MEYVDLLTQLLGLVGSARVQRSQDLAAALGTSVELVDSMLQELVQAGYLEKIEVACPTTCGDCSERAVCQLGGRVKVWALTERGKRAAHLPAP
ncbi:MAG: FeoC like transcriptional regulator [Chloroflexi bacterium ADurb.Bin180]|nr:MAG: FeoC like transcriptional regulator [Chloroflexi bacterium ADurb.Bin180]